ncbi:hypothetical protein B0T19DRAFT_439751 [Cercophora scortea]|uniref:ARB-07466-like C-terminal domain-containing protein n=1 Tax=Cercophora scortea TaxID=314031 RepID=A0AAE0IXV5_9PEZI|nr:hypothetical protein B0T19DRAFT_439751 [Cercophora scortea]
MIRHLLSILAASAALAAVNGPCYGSGVCVTSATCAASSGTTITGGCPADAADILCCTKASCGTTTTGNCRWVSDCAGTTASNLCPGPAGMKCCSSSATGFGGYAAPALPALGACQQVSITGASAIVAAFPGRVRQIYCTRDCDCPGTSDHCCGKATDMMCSDAGGTATISGKEIAEWVMNHRTSLNLKYVIWGQKIWNPSVDAVMSWSSWRTMEDRGSITDNHWDHVHVSYN